ncbi:DUF1284 domain-containing protein [Paenibacillus sp. LHD-117]|uniref:DUF1284 domain-containing protein n=1 Tax=Paenibacillus sp. LHD-117 TaxID=3071412 RepID=UPI0027DF2990|nr:DUF1284 domain-containing protein [Paenibacillus sp. LHD-117]MDQ6418881.1 DUF1284 domain-containing protein [Paenibacillus sp. LHD-117]
MTIRLRGHHLLCLLGYRGKGYSDGFCTNMTEIYETLRVRPETEIAIIEGPDDICRAFPADQHSHCRNDSVFRKDSDILSKVGMKIGDSASWSSILERVAGNVQPDDIRTLCSDCRWEPYGLCKEGVAHIHGRRELRPLPEQGEKGGQSA